MAQLKGIYMTEVQWYNGTTWVEVLVNKSGGDKLSAYTGHIILFRQDTPAEAPSGMSVTVNFSKLKMLESVRPQEDEYTAFQNDDGIPVATKSPIIRYKIAIGTWTSEEVITVNPTWHYMMLKASFPTNAYTGGGTISTITMSSTTFALKFYFPAFTSSQLSVTELTLFKSLLGVASNWTVTNTGGGRTQTLTPASVTTASAPVTTEITDYGLAKILVTLNVSLSFPVSGAYTLSATFQSNDGDAASELPGTHTVTATIQVNTGSTTPFICSLDDDASMSISIA